MCVYSESTARPRRAKPKLAIDKGDEIVGRRGESEGRVQGGLGVRLSYLRQLTAGELSLVCGVQVEQMDRNAPVWNAISRLIIKVAGGHGKSGDRCLDIGLRAHRSSNAPNLTLSQPTAIDPHLGGASAWTARAR